MSLENCVLGDSVFELRQHLTELAVERGILKVETMATEMTEADFKLRLAELEFKKMQMENDKQLELARINAKLKERELALAEVKQKDAAQLKDRELALAEEKQKDAVAYRNQRLSLVTEGKLDASVLSVEGEDSHSPVHSSAVHNLRLVPKLNERDLDTFFILFERLAANREWSEADKILLLQCVVVGKAQEVFSALDTETLASYERVKDAILKAYELVPEAYRQKFRTFRRGDKQTHVEFVRDLVIQFDRWRKSSKATSYGELCDLLVLEQFKNTVSEQIATHLSERGVLKPMDAAVMADNYALTHKHGFGPV